MYPIKFQKPLLAVLLGMALTLGLVNQAARAQAVTDTLLLDFDGALAYALDHNPSLRVADLDIESAELSFRETRNQYLPSVNLSGNYNRNIKRPVIFLPDDSPFGNGYLEIGSENSFMGVAAASMPLLNLGLNQSLRASRIEKTLAREQFRGSRIELEYNVQLAFFDVLLARESMQVMRQSFNNASDNLVRTRRMHEQGMVAEYDLIRAEVQTENLRPNVLQAENAYVIALNYLKALIGMDEAQPVTVEGSLADMAVNRLSDFTVDEANRSLQRNSDLVQMDLQLDLVNQQAAMVRANGLPSLDLAGNYQYQTEANHFRFGDYQWVETFSAGLRLTIPLFNGFAIRNQTRQLEILGEQIKLQRDFLKDNLDIQLDNILKSMMVAVEKTGNARSNVRMAERGFQIAQTRYETGQGTLMELNDSEVALTQARFNLLQAKHEILHAKAEYDRFIGENKR